VQLAAAGDLVDDTRQVELPVAIRVWARKDEVRRRRRMQHRDLGRGSELAVVTEIEFEPQRGELRVAIAQ
jgi:hypothetical protein